MDVILQRVSSGLLMASAMLLAVGFWAWLQVIYRAAVGWGFAVESAQATMLLMGAGVCACMLVRAAVERRMRSQKRT